MRKDRACQKQADQQTQNCPNNANEKIIELDGYSHALLVPWKLQLNRGGVVGMENVIEESNYRRVKTNL